MSSEKLSIKMNFEIKNTSLYMLANIIFDSEREFREFIYFLYSILLFKMIKLKSYTL